MVSWSLGEGRGGKDSKKNQNFTHKNVMVSHDLLLGPDPQNELLPCSNAGEFVRCRAQELTSVFSGFTSEAYFLF